MLTHTGDTPVILSAIEYKIHNTQKEERFWQWLAEFYDREEKFEKENPRTAIVTMQEVFDSQWTCCDCQVTLCRQNARQLDYAIYGHVQKFHNPDGSNSPKSGIRNVKVSIIESSHIPGAWILKLDNIVIQLFLGADGHSRAQKRMKDFL